MIRDPQLMLLRTIVQLQHATAALLLPDSSAPDDVKALVRQQMADAGEVLKRVEEIIGSDTAIDGW